MHHEALGQLGQDEPASIEATARLRRSISRLARPGLAGLRPDMHEINGNVGPTTVLSCSARATFPRASFPKLCFA